VVERRTAEPPVSTFSRDRVMKNRTLIEVENTEVDASRDAFSNDTGALFFRAWRWWLPPALIALMFAILFRDPFAGDWDALDYTALALRGMPSPMLLGRMLFIFANRLAFEIAHALFNLPKEQAYALFKWLVIIESPLVVILVWQFTRRLTNRAQVATLAALLVALSPIFIFYSGQAMTEIPSLLLLLVALIIHLRGLQERRAALVVAGAALLGLGVNVRELALFYGAWLVIAPIVFSFKNQAGLGVYESRSLGVSGETLFDSETPRPKDSETLLIRVRQHSSAADFPLILISCLVFCICAFLPFAVWFAFDIKNYRAWWLAWHETSVIEQSFHPVALANFKTLFLYFFITAPLILLVVPFALFDEWRRNHGSVLLALGAFGLCVNLMLILHYSVTINPRYMLTGLPALAPLAASFLLHRAERFFQNAKRAFASIVILIFIINIIVGALCLPAARHAHAHHQMTAEYLKRLQLLPSNAVIIAGGQSVAIGYWRGLGAGEWETISTGSGFPNGHLRETIENYLRANRRVFLDADPRLWTTRGWQGAETREVVGLQNQFHFRKISDTIYELRPVEDETAQAAPDLQKLLEN
jgi:4-amino-4-deoxy-L-arabinose transferase-like glycosyltransferase